MFYVMHELHFINCVYILFDNEKEKKTEKH